jgi:hypothetical protein
MNLLSRRSTGEASFADAFQTAWTLFSSRGQISTLASGFVLVKLRPRGPGALRYIASHVQHAGQAD